MSLENLNYPNNKYEMYIHKLHTNRLDSMEGSGTGRINIGEIGTEVYINDSPYIPGGGGGGVSIGAPQVATNNNSLILSGMNVLSAQIADATFSGIVSATAQQIKGQKEFIDTLAAPRLNITAPSPSNVSVSNVLSLASNTGLNNVVFGRNNMTAVGTGSANCAFGVNALQLTSGSGAQNCAFGTNALTNNTTGTFNIAIGTDALTRATISNDNIAIGTNAIGAVGSYTGTLALAIGTLALSRLTTGVQNTGIGHQSGQNISTGFQNTIIGCLAGSQITTGNDNTLLGRASGPTIITGSNNICVGSNVSCGNATNNNIAIGASLIGSPGDRCAIGSIRGQTTGNLGALAVLIDSAGQLGTVNSSSFLKTNVNSIVNLKDRVMKLEPVTFDYKCHLECPEAETTVGDYTYKTNVMLEGCTPEYADSLNYIPTGKIGSNWGLMADKTKEIFPELIVETGVDKLSGRTIETVLYQNIPIMLLAEVQRLTRENDALLDRINKIERLDTLTPSDVPNNYVPVLFMNEMQRLAKENESILMRITKLENNK